MTDLHAPRFLRELHALAVVAASLVVALPGCSSSTSTASTGSDVVFALDTSIPAFGEAWRCRLVRMPHVDGETFVRGGTSDLSTGTHHFLLYRTSLKDIPAGKDQTSDCTESGAMQYARGWVTGSQVAHDGQDFPAGVALPFASDEVLLLEGHFLNPSGSAVDAHVNVTLHTAHKSDVTQRAGVLQFYDPYIYVAARGKGSAQMRCPIPHDITLLSAGSHMHKDGKRYDAFLDLPGASPSTEPFYTTTDNQHPAPWLGVKSVPAGSFVRYACNYENVHDHDVTQGPSADEDEMCMFGGFYYPAMQPEEEECYGQDQHGSGAQNCADTTACLAACPASSRPNFPSGSLAVGACWQKCIAESCPNVTHALFPQLTCTDEKCSTACVNALDPACATCVATECKTEWNTCQALACGP